eukprot:scaffold24474_cov127-Isochrysis_galbana.AAC.4
MCAADDQEEPGRRDRFLLHAAPEEGGHRCNYDEGRPLRHGHGARLGSLLEALEQALTCMICRDTYVHPVFLQCGHTFCCECLAAYFRTGRVKKICPLCKIHVRPKDAQPNLLAARLVVLVSSPNVA